MSKDKTKFWKYINKNKKIRSNNKEVSISPQNLFDHYRKFFFENYDSLTPDKKTIEQDVKNTFNNYTRPADLPLFHYSSLELIINQLKNSNVQGFDSLTYSLIKNIQSESFKKLVLSFYNLIIQLGEIPKGFNHSIIKPIIKNQDKNASDTNNIRPLSISNCLAQIFEKLILHNSPDLAKIHKNQFGFKKNTSCNHAIFTLKETIINYIEHKSSCKIASLDAEKAFDKVWRMALFHKLKSKLNITYWYILKKYYDSSMGVILDSNYSPFAEFEINCGVKQGGILSPFLFNIFLNDLIEECTKLNIGACIGNVNVSIIVYADDIILISPIDSHLQKLLNVCTEYSNKWLIKFNPSKSNIISFGKSLFPNRNFYLSDKILNETKSFEYLGIEINNDFDFNSLAITKFDKVQKSILSLSYLGLTPKGISPHLKAFLYKTYCLSQFIYGLETSTLNIKTRNIINLKQNTLIRQLIGINKYSHISDILKCLRIYDFHDLYISSKLSFLEMIKSNELSLSILNFLCSDLENINKHTNSFKKDIQLVQSHFDLDIAVILVKPKALKNLMKKTFNEIDGLADSINTCLFNIKQKPYRDLLILLTRPNFLTDHINLMQEIILS
jgi:hypothetical protein